MPAAWDARPFAFFPFRAFSASPGCSSRLPLSAAWGCPFAAWDTRPFAFFPFRAFSASPGCSSRLPLSAAWGCPFAAWDTRPFAFFPFRAFSASPGCSSRLPLSAAWGCPFAAWDTRPFAFFPFPGFLRLPRMLLPLPAVRPVAVAARKKGMPLESGIPVRAGPVSRVLFPGRTPGPCHLSRAAVSCRLKQPTPRHRASNP